MDERVAPSLPQHECLTVWGGVSKTLTRIQPQVHSATSARAMRREARHTRDGCGGTARAGRESRPGGRVRAGAEAGRAENQAVDPVPEGRPMAASPAGKGETAGAAGGAGMERRCEGKQRGETVEVV